MRDHVCPSEVMLSQADVFVFVGFFFVSWVFPGFMMVPCLIALNTCIEF